MNLFLSIFVGFWAIAIFFGCSYMGLFLWIMAQAGIQKGPQGLSPKMKKMQLQSSLIFIAAVLIGTLLGGYLWSWAKYFWVIA